MEVNGYSQLFGF